MRLTIECNQQNGTKVAQSRHCPNVFLLTVAKLFISSFFFFVFIFSDCVQNQCLGEAIFGDQLEEQVPTDALDSASDDDADDDDEMRNIGKEVELIVLERDVKAWIARHKKPSK